MLENTFLQNNTSNETADVEFELKYLRVTVVTLVSCLIILTNVINLIVLSKTKHIPKIAKISLLNLSAGDLLVGFVSCLPCIIPAFTGRWIYGAVWCQIAGIVHGTSVTISIWSLSLVSIDRYLAITRPLNSQQILTPKRAKIALFCLWLAAAVTFFSPLPTKPSFVYYQYDDDESLCGLFWEYKWFCVVTALYIPCASGGILIFTNAKILSTIFARKKTIACTALETRKPLREMKAVKMLIFTSSAYFIAWGPYVAEVVTISLGGVTSVPGVVKFSTIWMANCNSFMNVFIYSFMYKSFRTKVRDLLYQLIMCCLPKKQRTSVSPVQRPRNDISVIDDGHPSAIPLSFQDMFQL